MKRLAIVNWDGTNHGYITQGETTVVSPRLSPDGQRIAYMSFADGTPHVRIMDVDGSNDHALLQSPGDELRSGLLTGRPQDRFLHGGRREIPTSMSSMPAAAPRSG